MISPIPGWTFRTDDRHVTLARAGATIRYTERVRPLAGVAEIVHRHCEAESLKVTTIGKLETALTHEGEYAAVVVVDGEERGHRVQHTLGYVLVDDFYSETVGVAHKADDAAAVGQAVRKLVASDSHFLAGRRRQFPYRGPEGWRQRADGSAFVHRWRPADPDANPAELVVAAAFPAPGGDSRVQPRLLAALSARESGFVTRGKAGPEAIRSGAGMPGSLWHLVGERDGSPRWIRLVALLRGPGYVYALHLDTPADQLDENRRCLDGVTRSIQAIPTPPRAAADDLTTAVHHWVD